MITQELINYIKERRSAGASVEEIKNALKGAGWEDSDINKAIAEALPSFGVNFDKKVEQPRKADIQSSDAEKISENVNQDQLSPSSFESKQAQSPSNQQANQNQFEGIQPVVEKDNTILGSASNAKSKRTIPLGMLVAIFVGLIALGVGAFGAIHFLRYEDPNEVLSDALVNLSAVKSMTYEIKADAEITAKNKFISSEDKQQNSTFNRLKQFAGMILSTTIAPDMGMPTDKPTSPPMPPEQINTVKLPINLEMKGGIDRTDANKPLTFMNPIITITIPSTGILPQQTVTIGGEIIVIDRIVYARLTKFPREIGGEEMPQEIVSYLDKWIRIDPDSLTEMLTKLGIVIQNIPIQPDNSQTDITFSPEEEKKVSLLLKRSNVFDIDKLNDENVESIDSYHYKIVLNSDGLISFVKEVRDMAKSGEITFNGNDSARKKFTDLDDKQIEYMSTILGKTNGEIWIDKENIIPRRLKMNLVFSDPSQSMTFSINTDTYLRDFNQPLNITAPKDFIPLEKIIQQQLGGMQKRSRDAARKASISQLQAALEFYFDKYGKYPADLLELKDKGIITSLPTDPKTDNLYYYSVSPDRKDYHLGADMESADNLYTSKDADFNSKKAGWKNGFDGSDNGSCMKKNLLCAKEIEEIPEEETDRCIEVAFCYDKRGFLN